MHDTVAMLGWQEHDIGLVELCFCVVPRAAHLTVSV
jgi:hypothetical protein